MKLIFVIMSLFFFLPSLGGAQEEFSLDWDFSTIFDEPPLEEDPPTQNAQDNPAPATVLSQLRQRGITFDASWLFLGGIAPGWTDFPWSLGDDDGFSWGQHIRMQAGFRIRSQISDNFRTQASFSLNVPNTGKFLFTLEDFFIDYIINDTVFVRAGKFNLTWGISNNFRFTNLPSRIPYRDVMLEDYHDSFPNWYNGDSYLVRADIPAGIGGLQLLAVSRAKFLEISEMPGMFHIGYGAKYNLALDRFDIDFGFFYHRYMPFRSFLSFKTTLGETEVYSEWLAVNIFKPREFSGAFNIGFAQDFLEGSLSLNGELFFNTEGNAFFYNPETVVQAAADTPFFEGFNAALNLIYRLDSWGNPRLLLRALYEQKEGSARLMPGLRLTPWPNTELYMAASVPIGKGHYFRGSNNPLDPLAGDAKRPLSFLLTFTLRGSVQAAHFY